MCCHDNGGEFTGWEFQKLISDFGIKDKPTTSQNPASNGICERMHQQIGNVLRIRVHEYPPRTLGDAQALVDEQLAVASHSIRSNMSEATGYSPGALAFHRDMFLDMPYVADLLDLCKRCQSRVDNDLCRLNAKRVSYDYKVNDKVLKKLS